MKTFVALLIALALCDSAFGRLGETRDQMEARYGLPKREKTPPGESPLIQGARELVFVHQGWTIRCAMLKATNGQEYIIREEYRKIIDAEMLKKGGVPQVRDFECEAVLKGESGLETWKQKPVTELEQAPAVPAGSVPAVRKQPLYLSGIVGSVWIREDGAVARFTPGALSMLLDLPQARKYETELKAIQARVVRQEVPRF